MYPRKIDWINAIRLVIEIGNQRRTRNLPHFACSPSHKLLSHIQTTHTHTHTHIHSHLKSAQVTRRGREGLSPKFAASVRLLEPRFFINRLLLACSCFTRLCHLSNNREAAAVLEPLQRTGDASEAVRKAALGAFPFAPRPAVAWRRRSRRTRQSRGKYCRSESYTAAADSLLLFPPTTRQAVFSTAR